jgi:hypothetical protein
MVCEAKSGVKKRAKKKNGGSNWVSFIFIKENRFSDGITDIFEPNSLAMDFVRSVWNGLENPDKTKESYGVFCRELESMGLIAK